MSVDQLVQSVTPYQPRPVWGHLYVAPLIALTAVWTYIWTAIYGIDDYYELGLIGYGVIGVILALVLLFCHWMVNIRCALTCSYIKDINQASHVCVEPTQNNGWAELVKLQRTKKGDKVKLWFEFQRVHYTWDAEEKRFSTAIFDTNRKMEFFQKAKGFETDDSLNEAKYVYGDNKTEMVIPQFYDLFIERATAPFFVFQVFCVGLWCLEDMWYYSLFTLMMLMTFEAMLVKQQMKNLADIRNMGNKSSLINTYRNRKWIKVKSEELVAGDVISIGRSTEEETVPCDILLLRGSCIVDESMLTGESVPQMKEPIETVESNRYLDLGQDSRLHIISGGTKIVQHTPSGKGGDIKSADNGVLCYVIRTGFNTNQGKLLRTIMFGVKRVTANNMETFAFIVFLLFFAVAASVYLWIDGVKDERRNKYKLFLECTLIITSVVPPELPIELSLAVNSSLVALQKLGIFCTEPFRIPFAGKVDVCCFDKTGTLTTDNLVVEGIAVSSDKEGMKKSVEDAPPEAVQVLATCHSLVWFDEDLVGDPLEQACLNWSSWTFKKNNVAIPPKTAKTTAVHASKIIQRFHFSSALKRMTTVAGYNLPNDPITNFYAAVKGAPEVLKDMYEEIPEDYDETYMKLTRKGARVLAMGIRPLGKDNLGEVSKMSRDQLERNLKFVGFVVISCPLKKDTKEMIAEIINSSHQVVMITGDNPLTACHVAKVLKFTKKSLTTMILDEPTDGKKFEWTSVDGETTMPLKPASGKKEKMAFFQANEFCVTGPAFKHLVEEEHTFLRELLPYIKVYARMAPKQKERVINELKALGRVTLMCGDGTNDVGALKHANVGVALLTHPYDPEKMAEKEKERSEKIQEARKLVMKGARVPQKVNKDAPAGARPQPLPQNPMTLTAQAKLDKLMAELEEEDKAMVVKLGDASYAAPFTSKFTSIASICHVIKQGRCTLVTTLQMFKILALNALVSAYSLSALYLDGVKYSDTQATIQGLLLAACFFFISRSKPLKTLSRQRPLPTIFNAYMLLTVTIQFCIHFSILLYLVGLAHEADPKTEPIDLEAKFTPNILNTTVYIISMALQVCTFAVNYRGRPFMESLFENKAMLYSVVFSGFAVFSLAWGASDDMMHQFELVKLPENVRDALVKGVSLDIIGCYIVDRTLNFVLGDSF